MWHTIGSANLNIYVIGNGLLQLSRQFYWQITWLVNDYSMKLSSLKPPSKLSGVISLFCTAVIEYKAMTV